MLDKKLMASLLLGVAAVTITASPTFAKKDPNGYAANQLAMQMWMNQQANNQNQAYWAQQNALNQYYAAQNAWAQRTVPPGWVNNGYGYGYGPYTGRAYGGERWGHYYRHRNGW